MGSVNPALWLWVMMTKAAGLEAWAGFRAYEGSLLWAWKKHPQELSPEQWARISCPKRASGGDKEVSV